MSKGARLTLLVVSALAMTTLTAFSTQHTSASATRTFTNPIYKHDFPDPYVMRVGKTYYAYATNTGIADIPTLKSTDLVHWTASKDSMPLPPRWVASNIWAPDVYKATNGTYVMYFTGRDPEAGRQCIGYAVGRSPAGPFTNRGTKPFICQGSLGGDIDPAVFRDSNGKTYLLWKSDGNCCGMKTYLFSQQLSGDGTKLLGQPAKLDQNDASWEGSVVEAPFMWKHGGKYYLFYSANDYASYSYAVGYAACRTPSGPCTDGATNPILSSACKAAGPGGETIVTDKKGQIWMLYHAWRAGAVNDSSVGRQLWMDRLTWKSGRPVVHGPTCKAQPAPAT
jgi:beta-xylosidase